MATNTPNLNLLKKNPATDGNETFNIQTMLNENWDKVDAAVGLAQRVKLTKDSGYLLDPPTTNLDDWLTVGWYYAGSTVTSGKPSGAGDGFVYVMAYNSTTVLQLYYEKNGASIQWRYHGATWTAWKKIATTDSPAFTGVVTVPTEAAGSNNTRAANTAFVKTALDNALTGISSNAASITVADAGNYYAGANAEDVLQEIGAAFVGVQGPLATAIANTLGS
ncbi:pyocin knob domain-containing protein [Paenibacillus sp. sgz500958]|uniref:pyocin knob domain-containing protein n=1 Tax=Paenibacillus sp. sgz500958 TaxID=3242475 RepID=UPI0036D3AD54